MSEFTNDPGHGNSPAAWTMVVIVLLGLSLGTLFFMLQNGAMVAVSAVIVVIGLIVGYAMSKAGYGEGGAKLQAKEH